MEDDNSSRCSLLISLIISGILSCINAIEFHNFFTHWNGGIVLFSPLFEECIRFELIMKSVFSFFSLFASFSAFLVTTLLILNTSYFIEKLSSSFLNYNYFVFGPVLLAFSVLGVLNIDNIMYTCDKNNIDYTNKVFSFSNFIAVVFCFVISLVLTITIEFFNCVTIFIDSILRKNSGNAVLGNAFWYYVGKYRGSYLRSYNNNPNHNRNNLNTNRNLESNHESMRGDQRNNNININVYNLANEETNTHLSVRSHGIHFNNYNGNRNDNLVISHNENLSFERTVIHYDKSSIKTPAEGNLGLDRKDFKTENNEDAFLNVKNTDGVLEIDYQNGDDSFLIKVDKKTNDDKFMSFEAPTDIVGKGRNKHLINEAELNKNGFLILQKNNQNNESKLYAISNKFNY